MPYSVASLAAMIGPSRIGEVTSGAFIQELDEMDEPFGEARKLQYFPETISDSKGVNWAPKDIPGASLPLYQWVSSGERSLSFQAVFTTDTDFSIETRGDTKARALATGMMLTGINNRNIDIRGAVQWLRRFKMPRYGQGANGAGLTTAPRKLQLSMPGTGIGVAHGAITGVHDGPDYITAIMTSCEVEWLQYFPSGFPRIASVSLGFAQIAQFKQQVTFPGCDWFDDQFTKWGTPLPVTSTVFGYTLKAR